MMLLTTDLFAMILLFMKFTTGAGQLSLPTREMRLEEFRMCSTGEKYVEVFNDIVLSQAGRSAMELSMNVVLKETIGHHPIQASLELSKCQSKQDVGTCEYYTHLKLKDICDTTKMFGTFMKNTNFPCRCPMEAGEYYFNKTRLDLSDLGFLPLFDAYWKVKVLITEDSKIITCLKYEFTLKQVIKRQRN